MTAITEWLQQTLGIPLYIQGRVLSSLIVVAVLWLLRRLLMAILWRRATAQKIWEAILEAFSDCDDIDFAYPTQRFYHNVTEGKLEARAKPTPEAP